MHNNTQLKILQDDQVLSIHLAALELLWEVGVRVRSPLARDILFRGGCKVDNDKVYFPSWIVEDAVRKAPSNFNIYARNPGNMLRMGENRVFFQPMIGRLNIVDGENGKKRKTTIKDVRNIVKIADAMSAYDILHSGAIMPHIEGIPDNVSHVHGYFASVQNSSKIIKGTCRGRQKALDCIEMAAVLGGGLEEITKKPNIHTTCNIISPLEQDIDMIEGMIEYAKRGLPVDITAEPQMGATSPISLAGTIAQQTAEILSGVVIAQLVRPGAPVFFGTCGAPMDMRTGTIALGGIEAALLNAAHSQMAKFYGIPSRGTGCNTESKVLDIQAGFEKAMNLLLPALAGINMIFYPGTMEHATSISLESLVIDNEICEMVFRAIRGIDVNENLMALEVIKDVGNGGHFLGQKHTSDYLEKELYIPSLANRLTREKWEKTGSKNVYEKARLEVERILKEHTPLPLEDKIEQDIIKIIEDIEIREVGKKLNLFQQ